MARGWTRRGWLFTTLICLSAICLSACSLFRPRPDDTARQDHPQPPAARVPGPEPAPARPAPPPPTDPDRLPDVVESKDFVVAVARPGDTARTLAARYLGDADRDWMIEEYTGARTFTPGAPVVIPRRDWNPVGVYPTGYQLVPILAYHNLGPTARGRMLMAGRTFEQQMRFLHAEGFRALGLAEFLEFTAGRRQIPRKSVLIAFDDGYRSFIEFARPVLKELGFRATLFVYTDFVGAGPSALSWIQLRELIREGFDVQLHGKSHVSLRRRPDESERAYARRMEAELGQPLALFEQHLKQRTLTLAYPYGDTDDELIPLVVRQGYRAAFTVERRANPSFVSLLRIGRAQIYADMSLSDFAKNLIVFHDETLLPASEPGGTRAPPAEARGGGRRRLAAAHLQRSAMLERRGDLWAALQEVAVTLTIDPADAAAAAARTRLTTGVERSAAALVEEGRRLLGRGQHAEARRRFLGALAVQPTSAEALEALRREARER